MPVDRTAMTLVLTLVIGQLGIARAGSPDAVAQQITGLFMQSCVRFAGDRDSLRSWAKQAGLQPLPVSIQMMFLDGLPGIVFDASNNQGKLVLVSEDGGSCSTIAERANGPATIADLEKDMNVAKIAFSKTTESGDSEEKLEHREYVASLGTRGWLLLTSTVKAEVGQVMLTASDH